MSNEYETGAGAATSPPGSALPPTSPPGTPPLLTGARNAWQTWSSTLVSLLKSDAGRAVDASRSGSFGFPVLAALVNGLLVGIALMTSMAKASSSLESYYWSTSLFEGSDYALALVFILVASVVYLAARAGAIVALFTLRGRRLGYGEAVSLGASAYVASFPMVALCVLLALVPGSFAAFVGLFGLIFTIIFAETVLYTGIARLGRFEKSVVLPHALLTSAWLCVVSYVFFLVLRDGFADALSALNLF